MTEIQQQEPVPASASPRLLRSLSAKFYNKLILPILSIRDTPHSLALGVTLGLWVSLTPTVGMQITIVILLGTLIKANRAVAVALTWISNPVTFLPMYYCYYVFGLAILGRDGQGYHEIKGEFEAVGDLGGWDLVTHIFDILGLPLWVGSVVVATICSLPAYPLCRRYFDKRERLRRQLAGIASPDDQLPKLDEQI